jgi:hypothetical protein
MASPTQMHNVLCRSVTIEARFTASSRSSGLHRNLTDLYRASNGRVGGRRCMYRMIIVGFPTFFSNLGNGNSLQNHQISDIFVISYFAPNSMPAILA